MTEKVLVERHRPNTINEYLFQNQEVKEKVEKWIARGEIPNVMFSGPPGSGKTSLSKILIKEFDMDPSDVMWVNASVESGIGFIREVVEPWLSRASFSGMKIVQLEECDRLTQDAQQALRSMIEENHGVRWILTCNYPNKIIPALHSRVQHIQMDEMDEDAVLGLIADIMDREGMDLANDSENDVLSHVTAYLPDLRKILNSIDEHTDQNKMVHPLSKSSSSQDEDQWQALWQSGKFRVEDALEAAMLVDQNNFELFYQIMYENHHHFDDVASGIVLLSQYLFRAQNSANQSLHLQAFLYEAFVLNEE